MPVDLRLGIQPVRPRRLVYYHPRRPKVEEVQRRSSDETREWHCCREYRVVLPAGLYFELTRSLQGGLLLASYAVFATTTPPVLSVLDWTDTRSDYCLLTAFGVTLGGVSIGSALAFVLVTDFDPTYFREVRVITTVVTIPSMRSY